MCQHYARGTRAELNWLPVKKLDIALLSFCQQVTFVSTRTSAYECLVLNLIIGPIERLMEMIWPVALAKM